MRPITIEADGRQLQGILHSPEGRDRGYLLLISHGFRGSRDGGGRAVALAEAASRLGFWVLRYDFTPDQLLSCQIRELTTVTNYCQNQFGKSVILLGRSMGGSASLAYAAAGSEAVGLCLWATPWNLRETFHLALGELYDELLAGRSVIVQDQWGKTELTPDFLTDFDQYDLLRDVRRMSTGVPLLVVHGTDDAIVPVARARELFHQARTPKQLAIIEGGDHQFLIGGEQARTAVIEWLDVTFANGID